MRKLPPVLIFIGIGWLVVLIGVAVIANSAPQHVSVERPMTAEQWRQLELNDLNEKYPTKDQAWDSVCSGYRDKKVSDLTVHDLEKLDLCNAIGH